MLSFQGCMMAMLGYTYLTLVSRQEKLGCIQDLWDCKPGMLGCTLGMLESTRD